MGNKKNTEFTILKAIGITLVVIGHKGGISFLGEWFPIYSFHMPLFIFISGYFYKNKAHENIKAFIIKKIKTLLIPYFIWNLIYGIIVNLLKTKGVVNYGDNINFHTVFVEPWINGHQFSLNIASWFILSLFLVQVIYAFIRYVINKINFENEYIIMLAFILLGGIAVTTANNQPLDGMKLVVVRTSFLLVFYNMGIFYKRKVEKFDNIGNLQYFSIIFIIQYYLIYRYEILGFSVAFCNDFNKENIWLPFITSLTGIMFFLRISKILVNSIGDSKIISYIGENSWSIMMHHQFIFFLLTSVLGLIAKWQHWQSFNEVLYMNDPWYAYATGPENSLLIYVVAGIAIPLIMKYITDKIICKIKLKY